VVLDVTQVDELMLQLGHPVPRKATRKRREIQLIHG
jgi:hypothetical protein